MPPNTCVTNDMMLKSSLWKTVFGINTTTENISDGIINLHTAFSSAFKYPPPLLLY